ncbi:MAG: hypothetical protein ACFFCI_10380 [Promethearchaeota archaeon]
MKMKEGHTVLKKLEREDKQNQGGENLDQEPFFLQIKWTIKGII